MTARRLSFTLALLAGLLLASEASATGSICQMCVLVCTDKANGGEVCKQDCSPILCPGGGTSVTVDRAHMPNLIVKEGAACSLKLKSHAGTKVTHGMIHGDTCVLHQLHGPVG